VMMACCRRNGKHHCMMMAQSSQHDGGSGGTRLAQVGERCPCGPGMVVATHRGPLYQPGAGHAARNTPDQRAVATTSRVVRAIRPESANFQRGPPSLSECA
jgi:hypothetical protein